MSYITTHRSEIKIMVFLSSFARRPHFSHPLLLFSWSWPIPNHVSIYHSSFRGILPALPSLISEWDSSLGREARGDAPAAAKLRPRKQYHQSGSGEPLPAEADTTSA
jgi:hypothetical protein